jgi:hypothetical protein
VIIFLYPQAGLYQLAVWERVTWFAVEVVRFVADEYWLVVEVPTPPLQSVWAQVDSARAPWIWLKTKIPTAVILERETAI